MWFYTDHVTDISPVRALVGLKALKCVGSYAGKGKWSDLSPLEGMKLTTLICTSTPVSDLAPLQGMPLTDMQCGYSKVCELSPLKGMKLVRLDCSHTSVSDVSPLQDCASLKSLQVTRTKVTAAGVAALQQALPTCKIEWDDPSKTLLPPGEGGRRPDEGAKPKTPEPAASDTK
jgi:hypothetical protein